MIQVLLILFQVNLALSIVGMLRIQTIVNYIYGMDQIGSLSMT